MGGTPYRSTAHFRPHPLKRSPLGRRVQYAKKRRAEPFKPTGERLYDHRHSNPGTKQIPLGQIVITTNAKHQLSAEAVNQGLTRHASGDWGEVSEADRKENELSLKRGFRLLSVYRDGETKFWIITEADRSLTTVLMPEDY